MTSDERQWKSGWLKRHLRECGADVREGENCHRGSKETGWIIPQTPKLRRCKLSPTEKFIVWPALKLSLQISSARPSFAERLALSQAEKEARPAPVSCASA